MHTPTPWKRYDSPLNSWIGNSDTGEIVADKPHVSICDAGPRWEANAALIVRALNAHEAMKEALADIHDILSDILEDPDVVLTTQRYTALRAIKKSRQALALADGEEQS